MISECQRALDAFTLQPTPYDPDYVKGLYSDYTYSNHDLYPKAKGMIGNSSSSCSGESALTGSGYILDYDSDMLIKAGSYVGEDDIYPMARGEINNDPTSPSSMHCMMASHIDGSGSRVNNGRDQQTASGRYITHAQIRHARRVYTGELPLGPNLGEDQVAVLRFIINEQKDQINSEKRILERHREEADASNRRRASLSSHYSSSIPRRSRSHLLPGGDGHNLARNL
jgi:hypothetical protein